MQKCIRQSHCSFHLLMSLQYLWRPIFPVIFVFIKVGEWITLKEGYVFFLNVIRGQENGNKNEGIIGWLPVMPVIIGAACFSRSGQQSPFDIGFAVAD